MTTTETKAEAAELIAPEWFQSQVAQALVRR
jgi:hypothetical protein